MASIVQYINLMSDTESVSAADYTAIVNTVPRLWTSAWYDGTITVYFEATLDPGGSTRTSYAALYDSDGNVVSDSEVSIAGSTYNGPILCRSAAITLTNGKEYHVRTKRAVGNGLIGGARLVVKQSGTITKTATYIDFQGSVESRAANTYNSLQRMLLYPYDSDYYDGITAAYFEVSLRHSTGAKSAYAELYNTTDSSQVAEVYDSSNTYVRKRSGDIKSSLADGKVYLTRLKNGGGNTAYAMQSGIIIVQENFTKSASYLSGAEYFSATNTSANSKAYMRVTKSEWSTKTLACYAYVTGGHPGTGSFGATLAIKVWDGAAIVTQSVTLTDGYIPSNYYLMADQWSTLADDEDYRTSGYRSEPGYYVYGGVGGFVFVYTMPINRTLAASGGTRSVTGTAATLKKSSLVGAGAGSYSVSGIAVTLTKKTTGPTLDAAGGSYAVTGTAAGLTISRRLDAGSGSYGVTGTAAGLCYSRILGAGSGSYTVNGTPASFLYNRVVTATPGALVITGTAASFLYSRIFTATPGTYAVNGTPASFLYSRVFTATPGEFTVTETAATLTWIRGLITLSAGSADIYILGPIGSKTLKKSLSNVPASPGSFAVTGTAAGLLYSRIMPVSPGSYMITGTAASFLYNRIFTVTPGEYTVTGTAVDFLNGTNLPAAAGSFTVTGTSASLCTMHIFAVSEGTFTVTGTSAKLERTEGIMGSPGEFSVAGTEAALLKHSLLVADPDKSTSVITRYIADSWEGEFAQASLTTLWTPTDLPDDIVVVCFALDSRAEVASVTLGGRNFTRLASVEGTGSGYHRGELWYLVNPPHVESEFSITLNDSQGQWTLYRVEHYYNVNQYDPFGDVAATFAAGKYVISGTVEDVQEGQFPFDWIVNTIAWYALTPGVDQTEIFNLNTGHFARAMSHRYGDTGDLEFSWSFPGIAGDNVHIVTVFQKPSYRNTFTIDGTAATLLKVVEMTIHDAAHGITMSGIVLIAAGTYELVIDDGVHAVTMGNVVLTMPDTLTINDAAHAVTMPNATLVMPGLLTIHEAFHPVTMPNIALGGIAYADLDAFINIGGEWKDIIAIQVQTGGEWKNVTGITLRQ